MKKTLERAARAAAGSPLWRWLPGMLSDDGTRYLGNNIWGWSSNSGEPSGSVSIAPISEADIPDLTDAATVGCLLSLVREAWGDQRISARCNEAWHMTERLGWRGFDTEAECLVAALCAAEDMAETVRKLRVEMATVGGRIPTRYHQRDDHADQGQADHPDSEILYPGLFFGANPYPPDQDHGF